MNPQSAYIAVGANLGDRRANIESAIRRLREVPELSVTRVSPLLENPAVGGPADSPAFLNGVIEVQTSLGARELLAQLLRIEQILGRARRERWEPRVIDLDLILYGQEVIREEDLSVPHPLMHQRRFVLEPLASIAPDAMHPLLKKTAKQILDELVD